MRIEDVALQVSKMGASLAVITGGEPGLQVREAAALGHILMSLGIRVEIETNGTVPLGELATLAHLVVVSPKLANSNLPIRSRLRWSVLADMVSLPHTVFKFVVESRDDLLEADGLVSRLAIPASRVWIMPEATNPTSLIDRLIELAEPVAARGWSLSSRLQVLLWENDRGH